MAVYTKEIATDMAFPNITVWRILNDGVHCGFEVRPNDGYVMYDTEANNITLDEDGNEIPVTYYYMVLYCPLKYDFDNFTWIAVLRSEVDENYIFGLGDKTETI